MSRPRSRAMILARAGVLFGLGFLATFVVLRGCTLLPSSASFALSAQQHPENRSAPQAPAARTEGPSIKTKDQLPAELMSAHGAPHTAPVRDVPAEPAPERIILISGHTAGWLTPCGCAGSQAGGIARRAGYRDLLRAKFPGVPITFIDQGGLLTHAGDPGRIVSGAVLDSLARIGYGGVNVVRRDLPRSSEEARFINAHGKSPQLSANILYDDTGAPAFPPYLILGAREGEPKAAGVPAPLRVALLGVSDDRFDLFAFGPGGRSLVLSPMTKALERYVPELRSKADLIVLLSDSPPQVFRTFNESMRGIDLIVCGEGPHFVIDPMDINGTPLIAVGNQGKYLAEIRIHRKGGKPSLTPFVHWLDETVPEVRELAEFAEGVLDQVNEVSKREALEDRSPPRAIAPYVSASACQSCHGEIYDSWQRSAHARAAETLVPLKRDYALSCLFCHVTGTDPDVGTFVSLAATPQLAGVQCEACHGPAAQHLADPSVPYGKTPDYLCVMCHTPATDPEFKWEVRWPVIAH